MGRFSDQKEESKMRGKVKEPTRKYRLVGGGNHGMSRVIYTRGDELQLTKSQAKKLNADAFPVKRVERVKSRTETDKPTPTSVPEAPATKASVPELTADEELLTGNVSAVVAALKSISDEDRLGELYDLEVKGANRKTVTEAITTQIMSDSQENDWPDK